MISSEGNTAEPPTPLGDDVRRTGTGAICPACQLSQRLGLPHACIAGNPGHPNGRGSDLRPLMYKADTASWSTLIRQLDHHPAAPRSGPFGLRVLDRTWCFCQHQPTRPG